MDEKEHFMTDLNTLIDDVARLIGAESPTLSELRLKMVELDEFVHSTEFDSLTYNDRTRFQAAYKELRDCIRAIENPSANPAPAAPGFETSLGGQAAAEAPAPAESHDHNPYAEQQMEEAEKLFYGGRYAEAIKLYDGVLQVEPRWERARQHR